MKKLVLYIILIVCACFIIPVLLTTNKNKIKETNSNNIENPEENTIQEISSISEYNYSEYNTIKLLHTKTNEIEEVNLDEYLLGVVSAEMPASFEQEALNAQAVVARTYTMYKIIHNKQENKHRRSCNM